MPEAAGAALDDGPLLRRLRSALAPTSEVQRAMMAIELTPRMREIVSPAFLAALRPAAVLIAVMPAEFTGGEPGILLTRRAEHLRSHQGQVSFPGGGRDAADADLTATALREAYEEVGLPPQQVEVIGYLDDCPTVSGYRVTPVVGLVRAPVQLLPHAGEVAEVFELPLSKALYDGVFERRIEHRDGIDYPVLELYHGPYRIWGATAAMLAELRRRLHDHE